MKKPISLLLSGITALLLPQTAIADEGKLSVVELFTSQGCSSCPPADELVGELAEKHNDDVLALAYHVDYWNYIGWEDPYSKAAFTDYQRQYASVMRSRRVYTPQMVINGRHDVVGSRRNSVLSKIVKNQHDTVKMDAKLSNASDAKQSTLSIAGSDFLAGADIILVTYIPSRTTKVKRGENSGRTLVDTNIVESTKKLGSFSGDASTLTIDTPEADRLAAVILRDPRNLNILAASKL